MYSIFVVLLALLNVSVVVAKPETNAQRMARGLPPLPPSKFARRGPTPVLEQKRSTPSSVPSVQYAGRIQVREGSGSVGYLKNWDSAAVDGVQPDVGVPSQILDVSFTTTGTAPFDILATNPNWSSSPDYIGIKGDGTVLAVGSANVVGLGPVSQGSGSAVWTIDPTTKQLKPHYINPDGSKPSITIAWDPRENEVFFTGDLSAWNTIHGETPASAVTFYLADLPS